MNNPIIQSPVHKRCAAKHILVLVIHTLTSSINPLTANAPELHRVPHYGSYAGGR